MNSDQTTGTRVSIGVFPLNTYYTHTHIFV